MGKRQAIRERRSRQKQQQRLTTILIVSGIALIIVALLMLPTIRAALAPVGEFVQPSPNPRPMADHNTMGDPNAPVVIEEYSDFGCGHCAAFAQGTGEEIADAYVASGQVYFIYHSVGSLLGHPNTPLAAEAAYCAGDQNKFWEYHDMVFANQRALFGDLSAKIDKTLTAYAEALGLDMDAFNACVKGRQYRDQVQQDEIDARQAGVSGTPTFLINGTILVGDRSFEEFQQVIEAELAKNSN